MADLTFPRRLAAAGRRALLDPSYRGQLLARVLRARDLHQTTPLTWRDRYPEIFAACRRLLDDCPTPDLLSFGCSTGEEVVTLREYFPTARIVGAEINEHSPAVCRARRLDQGVRFVRSSSTVLSRLAPYDAVFALAVLQRTPERIEGMGIRDLRNLYLFERFDAQISEFDRWLRPGGLLVVHHTQYRFDDATVAPRYERAGGAELVVVDGLKFDRASRRIGGAVAVGSIFRKLA